MDTYCMKECPDLKKFTNHWFFILSLMQAGVCMSKDASP